MYANVALNECVECVNTKLVANMLATLTEVHHMSTICVMLSLLCPTLSVYQTVVTLNVYI